MSIKNIEEDGTKQPTDQNSIVIGLNDDQSFPFIFLATTFGDFLDKKYDI